jgi:hypothetical protein
MVYYVVEFEHDKSIEAVPEGWVVMDDSGIRCAWPRVKARSKLTDIIKMAPVPDSDWKYFNIMIRRKCGVYCFLCMIVFTFAILLLSSTFL